MFTLLRPTIPTTEDLERSRAHVRPEDWEYVRAASIEDAKERIVLYDKAMALAETTPGKEPFDLERLYVLYGFEGMEAEFVLTQHTGLSYLLGYYIYHPEVLTLQEYAKYLDSVDRNID
jgi:hypothetical protein